MGLGAAREREPAVRCDARRITSSLRIAVPAQAPDDARVDCWTERAKAETFVAKCQSTQRGLLSIGRLVCVGHSHR